METIKSIFEILNSNLGGLFVMAILGFCLVKFGELRPTFKRLPELVDDMNQMKVDLAQLKLDMMLIKNKLGV